MRHCLSLAALAPATEARAQDAVRSETAVIQAAETLNAKVTGRTLTEAGSGPGIPLIDATRGEALAATGPPVDRRKLFDVPTAIAARGKSLTEAHITCSRSLPIRQYDAARFEERLRAVDLVTNFRSAFYRRHAILSRNVGSGLQNWDV